MGIMTVSVILLQTFNTFSDDVSDLFYILLLGLTWFKVDWHLIQKNHPDSDCVNHWHWMESGMEGHNRVAVSVYDAPVLRQCWLFINFSHAAAPEPESEFDDNAGYYWYNTTEYLLLYRHQIVFIHPVQSILSHQHKKQSDLSKVASHGQSVAAIRKRDQHRERDAVPHP